MPPRAPRQARYTGNRMTFEFKDIDIQNLLRVIAEISKKNIVVADDVTGKVTIRMRNVPWDQALDSSSRTKGLGMEEMGNMIRIAPSQDREGGGGARAEAARREAPAAQGPQPHPGELRRGAATCEPREGRPLRARLARRRAHERAHREGRARQRVQRRRRSSATSTPQTPQVLIESRIVEATTTSTARWASSGVATRGFGRHRQPHGPLFPQRRQAAGAAAAGHAGTVARRTSPSTCRRPSARASGGAHRPPFGSIGGALNLNLRLSAAETRAA